MFSLARKPFLIGVFSSAVAAAVAGSTWVFLRSAPEPAENILSVTEKSPRRAALYCEFYVFVESRPFVAFLLERTPEDPNLYSQVYVAKADGDRTDYNALTERKPQWRLSASAESSHLAARVTVPDPSQAGISEQDIAIELRAAARGGGAWREASLTSVYYQNLPGKCRDTQTGGAEAAGAPGQRSEVGSPGASSAATILPTEASRSLTASASDFVRI